MYKALIQANHQQKVPLHYIKLTCQLWFRNINLEVDDRTGPKTPQRESAAKPETPQSTILS